MTNTRHAAVTEKVRQITNWCWIVRYGTLNNLEGWDLKPLLFSPESMSGFVCLFVWGGGHK